MSGMFAFDWGVFWAVLAALGIFYIFLLYSLFSQPVPVSDPADEARLNRIEGSLNNLGEKIELADPHDTLDSIETLLECKFGMSAQDAREINIECKMAEGMDALKAAAEEKARKNKPGS